MVMWPAPGTSVRAASPVDIPDGDPAAACTMCSASASGVMVSSAPTTTATGASNRWSTTVRSGRAAIARCAHATPAGDCARIQESSTGNRCRRRSVLVAPTRAAGMLSTASTVWLASAAAAIRRRLARASSVSAVDLVSTSPSPATNPGCRSARARATYPPIECPTTTALPSPSATIVR